MNATNNQHKKFLRDCLSDKEKRAIIERNITWSTRDKTNQGEPLKSQNVIKKKLLSKHRDFKKITLTPIGPMSVCWQNARNTSKFDNKYEWEGGYEITACECGGLVTLVPHCVNCVIENKVKKYYDFTEDYNGLKMKCFLPDVKLTQIACSGKDPNAEENVITYGKKRCTCAGGRTIKWAIE